MSHVAIRRGAEWVRLEVPDWHHVVIDGWRGEHDGTYEATPWSRGRRLRQRREGGPRHSGIIMECVADEAVIDAPGLLEHLNAWGVPAPLSTGCL